MENLCSELVELGHVTRPYGLKGWLKIYSDTRPRENIASYNSLLLFVKKRWNAWQTSTGRLHGRYVLLKLNGCDDRDQAERLVGAKIAIYRSQLPPIKEVGEYYWADLVGMEVKNTFGELLGTVDHLFETGANDVMSVQGEREYLIPYLWGQVVKDVDLATRKIRVDWGVDY